MKRIGFALIACLAMPLVAKAGVEVTPGNVLRPSCNILFGDGKTTSADGYKAKNKKDSTGKIVAAGDIVFYVALEKYETWYSSTKSAEIKDKSPFTPDIQLDANRQYLTWGNFIYKGKQYAIINTGRSGLAVLDDQGMLCSDVLYHSNDGWMFAGMPQAYQEVAFTKTEKTLDAEKPVGIAVTLKANDAVSFTLEYTVLIDGAVKSRKAVSYDLLSGTAKLGDMVIAVDGSGKSGVKITSITEPSNYADWMGSVFNLNGN